MLKSNLPAPNISSFDSDSETLTCFIEQVTETAKINKWLDETYHIFCQKGFEKTGSHLL